jgi:hypothetical protein
MQTLTSAGGHVVTFVEIRQKTWPPCDFENSDWLIFKKLLKNR